MKISLKKNLRNINWGGLLNLKLNNVNFPFSQVIQKLNELLYINASYKYFKPENKQKITNHGLKVAQPPPSKEKLPI